MSRALSLLFCCLLGQALAQDAECVAGIPEDCRMRVQAIDVPPPGDPGPAQARELSAVAVMDRWSFQAYARSPDGRRLVVNRISGLGLRGLGEEEGTLVPLELLEHNPRCLRWDPASRRVAFWAPGPGHHVMLLDVDSSWHRQVYDPFDLAALPGGAALAREGERRLPMDLEWGPRGQALYVLERTLQDDHLGGVLLRLGLSERRVTSVEEVVRLDVPLEFVMVPPRDRDAQGRPLPLVVATGDDRLLAAWRGEHGFQTRELAAVSVHGMWSVAYHPARPELLLCSRYGARGPEGRDFRGLWRLSFPPGRPVAWEQVSARVDLDNVSYSPQGTYMTWQGKEGVAYRRPEQPAEQTVHVTLDAPDRPQVRGYAWEPGEQRLAIGAGDRLFLHAVGEQGAARSLLRFAPPTAIGEVFAAELSWRAGTLVLTVFEAL